MVIVMLHKARYAYEIIFFVQPNAPKVGHLVTSHIEQFYARDFVDTIFGSCIDLLCLGRILSVWAELYFRVQGQLHY